ncbi:MAG: 2-isopropylmalate synthase [Kofleriaceae bacterium]|nr:2-isopropylmalate synthase [Kofleriaceae bacterium]
MQPAPDRVYILDTTLRDGEQAPGATLTSDQKLEIAHALARLGVDGIEAGFPAASPDDHEAVRRIATEVGAAPTPGRPQAEPPAIVGLARAAKGDIDAAWSAVRDAAHPRIHVFLATSDLHMRHKLKMTRDEVLARAGEMVAYARGLGAEVQFSPEDGSRSDPTFLHQVLQAVVRAGATILNIPDTVGYAVPHEYAQLIASIRAAVPSSAIISVHCHDDLGLACANSLAGVAAGARQAEVTINGIGERAGNCSLEELVMALRTRRDAFRCDTAIDATQLCRLSRQVSRSTGFPVPPNKAVVGENAFAHESGIHQHGVLQHRETYEIMKPEDVGARATQLVLGKHSGRHAFAARLVELGTPLDGDALDRAFGRFKALAERKKEIRDPDLVALAADEVARAPALWELVALQVGCGTVGMPTATVKLKGPDGATVVRAAVGAGPIDAAFKAIDELVGAGVALEELAVQAVTEGTDALGEVGVRVRDGVDGTGTAAVDQAAVDLYDPYDRASKRRVFHGHAADGDIVVASVKAYLEAVNRVIGQRDVRPGGGAIEAAS